MIDDSDSVASHFGVFDGATLVASAKLTYYDDVTTMPLGSYLPYDFTAEYPVALFSRLIIDDRYRGLGISKLLYNARMEAAAHAGAKSAMTAVNSSLWAFYRSRGFRAVCEFVEQEARLRRLHHKWMVKIL
ncbi:MAG: GNAT family N-acetyltransferase [Armatimonadetes bacterium]|nr:GNAT family N-acetyltransferase [Armatimonadota bacterium]